MKFHTLALTAFSAAASVAVSAATAAAAPDTTAPVISYHAAAVGDSVVVTLQDGTFGLAADQRSVTVRDGLGQALDALPLAAEVDGRQLPIRPEISADARTLTLVPDVTGLVRASVQPVASPVENQLAMNDLINAVSISTSVGSLIGTAVGAVAGVGIGLAVAGASCLVLSLGCVVAVLPIVTVAGAVGGLTGLVLAGGPSAAVAAYNYVTTLNAAPGTSQYGQYATGANHGG
ncbi:hypothetical protein [Nocardia sp. NPDC004123]